ncbi:MAG: lipocalin family protein [Gemmatimonadota bacterium]
MTRQLRLVGFLAALTGILPGCTSDENKVGLMDLVGDYTATKLVFVSVANPSDQFDAIQAGITFDLNIASGGDYSITVHSPGDPDDVTTGTVILNGDKITLDSSDPISGTFTLNGNKLTIHITTGAEYDFDGDGTDDPATVDVIFQRT